MKYNFDEIVDRRNTYSSKYEDGPYYNPYLPKEYLPMWTADMDIACPQPMLDAMHARLDRRILGYSYSMDEAYYEAVTNWLERRHNVIAKRENIAFSTGVIDSIREAIHSMSNDGDGVMLHIPAYPYLYHPINEFDRKTVLLPLKEKDGYYTMDFEELEREASKEENTLLLLCNPHNPSGRVWTEEEMRTVAEICFRNNVKIFCDEIHNDLTRVGVNTVSMSALYPGDPRVVTAMSIGKTFNTAGNNHSYVVIYDPKIKEEFDNSRYCGSPNPLSIAAVTAAYNECEDWLDELREYLDGNFAYLADYLKEHLPKVKFRVAEGTYLGWMDMRAYGYSNDELNKKISQAGLYLEYGNEFVGNGDGYARINLACPRSYVARACEMLKTALGD